LTASIVIDASADAVWQVVAGQFDRIAAWATAIPSSQACPIADRATDAPVPSRICHTGMVLVPRVSETIVEYD
jgi:hypothetical protein